MSPTSIGAYEVLAHVGDGGMASVYRCRHRSDARFEVQGIVAVKLMHAHLSRDEGFRARFEREAAIGMALDHPQIVKVHDLVVDGGQLALVMEWVEGLPLDERLARGPYLVGEGLSLLKRILRVVGHAHAHGVVHRDLKPANILLTDDGVKVLDFGIAKAQGQSQLTQTGAGMGTPWYMAPEQYTAARDVDQRADIYALGILGIELLAGGLPWEAGLSEFDVLRKKAEGELIFPRREGLPEHVVAALEQAVDPDPALRHPDTEAFALALERTARSSKARKAPARKPPARKTKRGSRGPGPARRALRWSCGTLGCLSLLGVGTLGSCVGLGWVLLQPAEPIDSDGDGVPDHRDRCPWDATDSCPLYESVAGLWTGRLVAEEVPWLYWGATEVDVYVRVHEDGEPGGKVGDVDFVSDEGWTCGGDLVRSYEADGRYVFEQELKRYGGLDCIEGAELSLEPAGEGLDMTLKASGHRWSGTVWWMEEPP